MAVQVTTGATMLCSFGTAPSTLNIPPASGVSAGKMAAATIMDFAPMLNIPPFAMCTSLSNPTVASATSAALGALTPMPCVPAILGPWKPGSTSVMIGNKPALTNTSTCNCAYGGVIQFANPGQASVNTS